MTITHIPTGRRPLAAQAIALPMDEAMVRRLLDPTVNHLFGVTLDLSSLAASSGAEVAQRLQVAVEGIDVAIRRLRHDLIGHAAAESAAAEFAVAV